MELGGLGYLTHVQTSFVADEGYIVYNSGYNLYRDYIRLDCFFVKQS